MIAHIHPLLQDCAAQFFVLNKGFVECHDFEVGGHGECCQIRIRPDVGGKQGARSQRPPRRFDVSRFFREGNARIRKCSIVELPGISHRHRIKRKDPAVRDQPKKSLLSQSTKATTLICSQLKPSVRGVVMLVRLERECKPEINVRKQHLLHPVSRRSSDSSPEHYRVLLIARAETGLVSGLEQSESWVQRNTSRSRQPLRAASLSRPTQPRHFVQCQRYSCWDGTVIAAGNQEVILSEGVRE